MCYAGDFSRFSNLQWLELFDTDIVTLPSKQNLPQWFVLQQEMLEQEREEFEELCKKYGKENLTNHTILSEKVKTCTDIPAYKIYYYCNDGPLISSRSTYNAKKTIIDTDEND